MRVQAALYPRVRGAGMPKVKIGDMADPLPPRARG